VTGGRWRENLEALDIPPLDGEVLRAMENPIHRTGGITILRGSLAPDGAVVKSAGFEAQVFEGNARVFDGEQGAMDAVVDGTLQTATSSSSATRGPRGGPGMREMLMVTGAIKGAGSARTCCCSPTAASPAAPPACASATSPRRPRRRADRARAGRRPHPARPRRRHTRPAGRRRRARAPPAGWKPLEPRYTTGVLGKYAKLVGSAAQAPSPVDRSGGATG
jgi:dihydroxy-acid dehydratase